jgi:putative Mn2+ efflux pump MntP
MDAFSICISYGIIIPKPGFRYYCRLAFHIGLFQFMMPIIRYLGGTYLESNIKAYDH